MLRIDTANTFQRPDGDVANSRYARAGRELLFLPGDITMPPLPTLLGTAMRIRWWNLFSRESYLGNV